MNNIFITILAWQLAATNKINARREAGQGTLEYVGMFAVAAIIVVTLIGVASGFDFGSVVTKAIAYVTSNLPG